MVRENAYLSSMMQPRGLYSQGNWWQKLFLPNPPLCFKNSLLSHNLSKVQLRKTPIKQKTQKNQKNPPEKEMFHKRLSFGAKL